MLGMGPMEIAVILIIALIIFGPGKLPEIGQTVGRAVRDFRSATNDITGDFKQTMNELQETADDFKNTAIEFQNEAESTFRDAQSDLTAAAKDFETSTQETAKEVSEGLSLDQMESPATKPSASAQARIAEARDEYHKADSSNGAEKPARAKSSASKSKPATAKKKTASSSNRKAAAKGTSDKTRSAAKAGTATNGDRKKAVKQRKKRQPAALAVEPSSASKDDPLADLMGADDGPVLSSRSRRD
jgi:sec-independent protein translocase protein TatB